VVRKFLAVGRSALVVQVSVEGSYTSSFSDPPTPPNTYIFPSTTLDEWPHLAVGIGVLRTQFGGSTSVGVGTAVGSGNSVGGLFAVPQLIRINAAINKTRAFLNIIVHASIKSYSS
jgi:hypothetical protein